MNDSEISFEIEFKSQESTMQSAFFQLGYCGDSSDGGKPVPLMKPNLVLAPKAILTDLLHDKKLLPVKDT